MKRSSDFSLEELMQIKAAEDEIDKQFSPGVGRIVFREMLKNMTEDEGFSDLVRHLESVHPIIATTKLRPGGAAFKALIAKAIHDGRRVAD